MRSGGRSAICKGTEVRNNGGARDCAGEVEEGELDVGHPRALNAKLKVLNSAALSIQ